MRGSGDQVFEDVGGGADLVLARTSYGLQAGSEIETLTAYDQSSLTGLTLVGNELPRRFREPRAPTC